MRNTSFLADQMFDSELNFFQEYIGVKGGNGFNGVAINVDNWLAVREMTIIAR